GRPDAADAANAPPRRPPLPHPPAQPRSFPVGVLLPAPQQPPQPCLDRDQPSLQLQSVELAYSEAVPQRKQPLDFGEPPPTDRLRFATSVHQALERPLQVRPAQGPPLGREPVVGGPPVRPDHTRKLGAQ